MLRKNYNRFAVWLIALLFCLSQHAVFSCREDFFPQDASQPATWDDVCRYYVFRQPTVRAGVDDVRAQIANPSAPVTRATLSVLLYFLAAKTDPGSVLDDCSYLDFQEEIPKHYLPGLRFAYSRGLVRGTGCGGLDANKPLLAGEAYAILDRAFDAAPDYPVTQPYFLYRTAYLTFDDGTSENTGRILDILNQYGAKATFFVSGRSDPAFLLRMCDEGHAIGNHTMSHDYKKIYRSTEAFWEDFGAEGDYLESILGYRPGLMRFPGGSNTRAGRMMRTITKQALERGYHYFDWNVSAGDADGQCVPKETIVGNVLDGCRYKQEAVVLMHQSAPKTTTVDALPEMIEGLLKMGFSLVPLGENSFCPRFLTP